ncbi:MAG TPA: hypothetical protein VGR91_07515 [Stellaceae bacterium]|nr:hypothetical protein [Stellaceae bacterium]
MRTIGLIILASLLTLARAPGAVALTLENARVGFTAERLLVLDGKTYVGRIWHMPGAERHEQSLQGVNSVFFILHDKSSVADIVLPKLHTVAEFPAPTALTILEDPGLLQHPVGGERIDGIRTTKYAVDYRAPQGHATGYLWLSRAGIPIKCEGQFRAPHGRVTTIRWELRHLRIGPQPAALFAVPRGFSKLTPEALAPLLGLRLAPPRAR